MRETWEFVVVGAGPAGSLAAELFARRGRSVLLLDPKAPWEKPCGGGLTASALHHVPELVELEDAGAWIRELLVVAPGGASVVVPLRRPYLVVSRTRLSRWGLARAQAAGAAFERASVRQAERCDGGWRILDSGGRAHRARWLVAADGAASRLRGQLAPRLRPELAPTRVVYPANGVQSGRAVFLFLRAADGYVWDFPRRDHHSIGVAVPPRSFSRADLDAAIEQYCLAENAEPAPDEPAGAVIATADWSSGSFDDLGAGDYALLGDAAGLADPATGEGIDFAFRSAAVAADAWDEEAGFASYPQAARAAFEHETHRSLFVRRWLYTPGVADALVRWARRSRTGARLLAALCDAANEHSSLRSALLRALLPGRSRAERPSVAAAGAGAGDMTRSGGQIKYRHARTRSRAPDLSGRPPTG